MKEKSEIWMLDEKLYTFHAKADVSFNISFLPSWMSNAH